MGEFKLSTLIKNEKRALYPPKYKHILDAYDKAELFIIEKDSGNNVAFDGQLEMRFNTPNGGTHVSISVGALLGFLTNAGAVYETSQKYKFAIAGEPDTERTVKID